MRVVGGEGEEVAGGLGRGVGRAGRQRVVFGEGGVRGCQAAVDLVGGDLEEAEARAVRFREGGEVAAGGFEQALGAENVRAQKGRGLVDRAVHVGLGGEMHHGVGSVLGKEPGEQGGVGDVAVDEVVARVGA